MKNKLINWHLSDLKEVCVVYENCEYKDLKKESIRKLEFKTRADRAEALTIVLSFESIDNEFESFVNRKDIAQIILTKNDNEQVGPFFLEYITENENWLGADNLLEQTFINLEEKEVIIYYKHNHLKPSIDVLLNNDVEEKDIYQIEDISKFLNYHFEKPFTKSLNELLDGFYYHSFVISVSDTKDYYILSLTNTVNRKTTSVLFEKYEKENISESEIIGEYYDKELGVIVPEGQDAEDVYFDELSKNYIKSNLKRLI